VAGLNLYTDQFKKFSTDGFITRDYTQNTVGVFVQNTWQAAPWLSVETSLRGNQ
jgi:outer membrane receptor protein involved in Fe transport